MTDASVPKQIAIAIRIDNPDLAERLTALLSDVPGLRLVRVYETANVILVSSRNSSTTVEKYAALTQRELEVLSLLAEGSSNKAIANRLGISIHTAKFHVGSLLDKLDASGRTDAVTHAARLGVIHL